MGEAEEPAAAPLTPFLAPLRAVQCLLDSFGGRGVIVGGIAAGLLGEPRFTADVDAVLLLETDDLPLLLSRAAAQGLLPRIADAEAFAAKNRVLLLRHSESGIDVDLSLGMLDFEREMIQRSRSADLGGLKVRLPTPEDLIVMKAVAHRPKDLQDIRAILESHPKLDKKYIRAQVRQFAKALEMPELLKDLSEIMG